MNKKIGIFITVLATAVLMTMTVSAQTVVVDRENVLVKHTFYKNENSSAVLKLEEQESVTIVTKNGNVTVRMNDWGKEGCEKMISLNISYQDQSTIIILERGVWGMQVANIKLAKNVSVTIGLTDTFFGSPVRYAKICTSLWVFE